MITRISRCDNGKADALAKLAKEMADPSGKPISITVQNKTALAPSLRQTFEAREAENIFITSEEDDWREPFITYLKGGGLPKDKSKAHQISQRALRYALINDVLYRRAFDQMWLRCLAPHEAKGVIVEVHEGLCGAHQSGPKMKIKIKRLGYYWPSMMKDCLEHAKKCHQC